MSLAGGTGASWGNWDDKHLKFGRINKLINTWASWSNWDEKYRKFDMRQIVQKFHFETIFPSSLIVFQLVQVNVNAAVEFVKYFTVANFPIVWILPKKSMLIWTFLAKNREWGLFYSSFWTNWHFFVKIYKNSANFNISQFDFIPLISNPPLSF